jgi:hypothetical protein
MEKMLRQSYRKGDISMLNSKALDTVSRLQLTTSMGLSAFVHCPLLCVN